MNPTNVTVCPSCSAAITENYCTFCGEKKRFRSDLSMKHFVEESVEGISHFDNKFFRTIKLLFGRPGQLTVNFEQGRRVPFMKPFQLFIVSNLLFFLVAHGTNLFATGLSSFYNHYSKYGTREVIDKKLKSPSNESFIELANVFNEKMITQSKAFIILFIPVLGLAAALLFFRARKFLAAHLVFATHFFSFVLLYFILFFLLIELPAQLFIDTNTNTAYDSFVGIASIGLFVVYLTLATKRFYRLHMAWCVFASLLIAGIFMVALNGYRLMLFHKIMNSL